MKKLVKLMMSVLLVTISALVMTGCNPKIDGARFLITKAIIKVDYTAGKDTKEDKSDDIFDVSLSLTMTVNNTQNIEILVEKDKFAFSENYETFYFYDGIIVSGTGVNSGIAAPSPEGSTVVSWFKFELTFGGGYTDAQLEQLRSSLTMSYKGTKLNLPLVIQGK